MKDNIDMDQFTLTYGNSLTACLAWTTAVCPYAPYWIHSGSEKYYTCSICNWIKQAYLDLDKNEYRILWTKVQAIEYKQMRL